MDEEKVVLDTQELFSSKLPKAVLDSLAGLEGHTLRVPESCYKVEVNLGEGALNVDDTILHEMMEEALLATGLFHSADTQTILETIEPIIEQHVHAAYLHGKLEGQHQDGT